MEWLSHDLRTPLTAIRVLVEALEDGVVSDPESVARYHQMIGDQNARLTQLVDDLVELCGSDVGSTPLQFERIQMCDVLDEAVRSLAPLASYKVVELKTHIVGGPFEIDASSRALHRALSNLLDNAVRHSPAGGCVQVEAGIHADTESWVYVSVRDAGGGIAHTDLDRIFDAGFQSGGRDGQRGLGLAIAKGLIEAHHGHLTACNEDDGARFTFRLPRSVAA